MVFDVYVHNPDPDKLFWLKMWKLTRFLQEMGFKRRRGYLRDCYDEE